MTCEAELQGSVTQMASAILSPIGTGEHTLSLSVYLSRFIWDLYLSNMAKYDHRFIALRKAYGMIDQTPPPE